MTSISIVSQRNAETSGTAIHHKLFQRQMETKRLHEKVGLKGLERGRGLFLLCPIYFLLYLFVCLFVANWPCPRQTEVTYLPILGCRNGGKEDSSDGETREGG